MDLAYSVPGLGRFRVNVFQQRGTVGLVLRVIPTRIKTIDELGLPPVLKRIASEERGLVLVTGTTGSGKSTTLAAMIDYINATRAAHIMTVEDPIEYLHRDHHSIVNQREVAVDTRSFSHALRSALRQDPDVILVGEMRDFETVETALLAAETGHLVFSTLHTLDATETINRIITVFPPHQQRQVRIQLASVLKAAISQRLLPRADGAGRVAAVEVMVSTALHPRRDRRQGQDLADPRRDRRRHVAVRHADLRSVDLRPLSAGPRHARRGAALGLERRRVQAEGPGHLDHHRDGARRDGQAAGRRPRRPAGDHPVRWISRARTPKACRLLARRELSVEGVRARLEDRGYSPDEIAEAHRAAARERRARRPPRRAGVSRAPRPRSKRRGRLRVMRELLQMGIRSEIAAEALGEVYGELDERALIDEAPAEEAARPADARRPGRVRPALSISHAAGLLPRRRRRRAAEAPRADGAIDQD